MTSACPCADAQFVHFLVLEWQRGLSIQPNMQMRQRQQERLIVC